MSSSNDFDFIVGEWKVLNRRLVDRLNNCQDWIEFEADYRCWTMLGGLGNMDEIKLEDDVNPFYGMSMRMYNQVKKEWTIYWADSHHPEIGLKVQVVGSFKDGTGTFFGEEMYKNQVVKLRFIWASKSEDHAYWEQAYFDETHQEWEVNWTMDFKRITKGILSKAFKKS